MSDNWSRQELEASVLPRKPLASTARRAGWQGCYLTFNWESVSDVYC